MIKKIAILSLLSVIPLMAHASENIVRISAPISPAPYAAAEPVSTAWAQVGAPYNCSSWSPSTDTYTIGTSFDQQASCTVDEQRQTQARKYNVNSGQYVNVGSPMTESRTLPGKSVSRLSQGTKVKTPAGGCVTVASGKGFWSETRSGSKLFNIYATYGSIPVRSGDFPTKNTATDPTIAEQSSITIGDYSYSRGGYSHSVTTNYGGGAVTQTYYGVCQN